MDLKKLIKEVLSARKHDCGCGCGDKCGKTKAPILNENLAPREILSEGLQYHIDNKKPLTEHVYRAGSSNYFNLWAEARALYSRGILDFSGDDLDILTETKLGEFGVYEGQKVPLDFIFEEEIQEVESKEAKEIKKLKKDLKDLDKKDSKTRASILQAIKRLERQLELIKEAEYQGKKVEIGKPKRGGASGKKYYVYVMDKGKVKKVSFGDSTGLSAKINDPKARQAFAKRHDCANKKDRTKASYWSCRLPRYAKLLGLKSNFSGYW